MQVQLIHKVRNRQPTNRVEIDKSNKLARGLYAASIAGIGDLLAPSYKYGSDTVLATSPSGIILKQSTDGTLASSSIGFPKKNLSARTEIFGMFCSSRKTYGSWLSGTSSTERVFGEYADTELGWGIHGASWNTAVKIFDGVAPTLVGLPRIICLTWNKDKNSGYGRAFVDGKEVTRTGGTAHTSVSDRTQSSAISSLGSNQNVSGISFFYAFDRDLSESEIKDISSNPWQILKPETIPLFFSTVTAQYARPTSDVSAGTWTASTGSDLFAMLDEITASDTDYIITTGASTCEVALTSLSDPASSTGHIVRYRISATSGGITVRLRQGATTIATWTHASAPTSLTTYEQTLTGGEADSITDYTALKLQFEATA